MTAATTTTARKTLAPTTSLASDAAAPSAEPGVADVDEAAVAPAPEAVRAYCSSSRIFLLFWRMLLRWVRFGVYLGFLLLSSIAFAKHANGAYLSQ